MVNALQHPPTICSPQYSGLALVCQLCSHRAYWLLCKLTHLYDSQYTWLDPVVQPLNRFCLLGSSELYISMPAAVPKPIPGHAACTLSLGWSINQKQTHKHHLYITRHSTDSTLAQKKKPESSTTGKIKIKWNPYCIVVLYESQIKINQKPQNKT